MGITIKQLDVSNELDSIRSFMKEIIVYEMQYTGTGISSTDNKLKLIPFQEKYYSEYEYI